MDVADSCPTETATAELPFDVFARACPSRPVLEHLTGRWGTLVLVGLAAGPLRFGDLRRRIEGVSEKMLAQTLQQLERDGFVHREVRRAIPPHVEYSLTGLGSDTAPRLLELIAFLEDRMPEVLRAQQRHAETRTGIAAP